MEFLLYMQLTLKLQVRFSLPEYVVDLHKSAHFLVIHWLAHAAKAGVDFSSKHKLESSLGFLAESKRQAIVQSYAMIIDEACKFRWGIAKTS